MNRLCVRNGGGGNRPLDSADVARTGLGRALAPQDEGTQCAETMHGQSGVLRHRDDTADFRFQTQDFEPVLTASRRMPAAPALGSCLFSSPDIQDSLKVGRINARRPADERNELGPSRVDGERSHPFRQFLPTKASVNRWLPSTSIELQVGAGDTQAPLVGALLPDKSSSEICYAYNNWDASLAGYGNRCDGFRGGHSGWGVQTKSVDGYRTSDVAFHSLTDGVVTVLSRTFGKTVNLDVDADRPTQNGRTGPLSAALLRS